MEQHEFEGIQSVIDKGINALPDTPTGIKMGFKLAGEFLVRGLLTTEEVDMVLWKWEMRAYRKRYVYPDPEMGDYEYIVGKPIAA